MTQSANLSNLVMHVKSPKVPTDRLFAQLIQLKLLMVRTRYGLSMLFMGSSAANTSAKNILTVIDLHSRFVLAKAVKRITKEATVSFLTELFDSLAPPKALLSDNGLNFTSKAFNSLLDKRGVRHLLTHPFRSQANGVCERAQGSIVSGLRTALIDKPNARWSSLLREVVQNLNDVPHSSTGFAPRFLHFGMSNDSPGVSIEEARTQATERSRAQQNKNQRTNDSKAVPHKLSIGQLVRYQLPETHPARAGKLSPRFWAPCKIVEQLGQDTFLVDQLDPNSHALIRSFVAHSNRLTAYEARQTSSDTKDSTEHLDPIAQTALFSLEPSNILSRTYCTAFPAGKLSH